MHILGVNSDADGTSALVFDMEKSCVIAEDFHPHEFIKDLPPNHEEQDPRQWIKSCEIVIRSCIRKIGKEAGKVTTIGISAQMDSFVSLDKNKDVIRPAKLSRDCSAKEQSLRIAENFGGFPGLIELIGRPVYANTIAAKILWIKENEPQNFRKIKSILTPHDFINFWLTGVQRIEVSAAATTGLYDVISHQWSQEICNFIDPGLYKMLPKIGTSSQKVLAPIRRELAEAWGLPNNVLVSRGGSEAVTEALNAGAADTKTITVSLGKAARVSSISREPLIDYSGRLLSLCASTDSWLLQAPIRHSHLGKKLIKHYGENSSSRKSESTLGAGGLLFLPESSQSSLPKNESTFLPELCGLNEENFKPANLIKAAIECTCLTISETIQMFQEKGISPERIRVVGSEDKEMLSMISDATGLPVERLAKDYGPAFGAVLQATIAYYDSQGDKITIEEISRYAIKPDVKGTQRPNKKNHSFYKKLLTKRLQKQEACSSLDTD